MAFDEGLAQRLRELLEKRRGITEKKMFGGLCFMAHGHMFLGIVRSTLMARVGPEHYAEALKQPHAREMDFTGRPMKGYVFVEPAGFESDAALAAWVARTLKFVATLPSK
jgi:TfoX/Sxy family transcriptional regulator of competence genes